MAQVRRDPWPNELSREWSRKTPKVNFRFPCTYDPTYMHATHTNSRWKVNQKAATYNKYKAILLTSEAVWHYYWRHTWTESIWPVHTSLQIKCKNLILTLSSHEFKFPCIWFAQVSWKELSYQLSLIHIAPWKDCLLNTAVSLGSKGKHQAGQSHAYLTTVLAPSHSNISHLEWEAAHTLQSDKGEWNLPMGRR